MDDTSETKQNKTKNKLQLQLTAITTITFTTIFYIKY